jgi:hypothetical protein
MLHMDKVATPLKCWYCVALFCFCFGYEWVRLLWCQGGSSCSI